MIQLKPSMLEMRKGLAADSTVDKAIDGDNGTNANSPNGKDLCTRSSPGVRVHWLAIRLEGLFLVSRVRVSFRQKSGKNSVVYVGNNPSNTNGTDDYQCGERWIGDVQQAPHFHNFTCQPHRWVSHVSVQRHGWVIQICEVEVYYTHDTTKGIHTLHSYLIGHSHIRFKVLCWLCFLQESWFHSPLLLEKLFWVIHCSVGHR